MVVEDHPAYAHTITSGVHRLRGDLMPEAGGCNEGPSPKEYIMAALGMCTSMTVRMYAQRHAWPLQHVEVAVRENTRPNEHLPQGLHVDLRMHGALTDEQRRRLERAANMCPVKRMLRGEMMHGIQLRTLPPPGASK